jgi:sec-independent protein translocase protein TatA
MSKVFLFGMPQGLEWLVILGVVLLLFGGNKLPQLAKALGQSKRAFKEGQLEAEEEATVESAKRRERLRAAGAIEGETLESEKVAVSKER